MQVFVGSVGNTPCRAPLPLLHPPKLHQNLLFHLLTGFLTPCSSSCPHNPTSSCNHCFSLLWANSAIYTFPQLHPPVPGPLQTPIYLHTHSFIFTHSSILQNPISKLPVEIPKHPVEPVQTSCRRSHMRFLDSHNSVKLSQRVLGTP